jgi:hypothetical protein
MGMTVPLVSIADCRVSGELFFFDPFLGVFALAMTAYSFDSFVHEELS